MRITSQMLSESAQKAGVEVKHSLLDYINSDNKSSTLQQVLSANKMSVSDTAKEKNYKELDKLADSILANIKSLAGGDDDSVLNKLETADDDENRKALLAAVGSLVDDYNTIRKDLVNAQGTLNTYYAKLLKDDVEEHEELLEKVGITYNGSGLELDENKLSKADISDVKNALGGNSTYMEGLYIIVNHISDNVEANLKSLSSQYNSSGVNYYSATGRYDVKG